MISFTVIKLICIFLIIYHIPDAGNADALFCCFIADMYFILYPEAYDTAIILFSIGHLLYAKDHINQIPEEWEFFSGFYLAYIAILLVFTILYRGNKTITFDLYGLILCSNVILTAVCCHHHKFIGYMLFAVSDLLILIRDFVRPFPAANYWVLGAYFTAQYLLNMA